MPPCARRARNWGRSFVAEPANVDVGVEGAARVPRVLSIAGTDPTGGAGLFADLKAIAAMGGYGMGAVTSITAQNTIGVQGVYPQPVEVLRAQLESISADVAIDAVKIGMLGEADAVRTVAAWLASERPPIVVMDPVMVATTGGKLSTDDATAALVELARSVSIVTPNVPELGVLAGEDTAPGIDEVVRQATKAHEQLGVAVLATTGDLEDASHADILVTSGGGEIDVVELPFTRVETPNTHGTGCSMSSALATARVISEDWPQAYGRVRPWMDGALLGGLDLDVGRGSGPLDHNWYLHV